MAVSRETPGVLEYEQIVLRWDRQIRLIGGQLREGLRPQDLLDPSVLTSQLTKSDRYVDVGSGNGLPAIPTLLALGENAPTTTLVESDARKAAFLRAVRRELGLDYEVLQARIESVPSLKASAISAKAFAPLSEILSLCALHLCPAGRILAFKGHKAEEEIAVAMRTWDFDLAREEQNPQTGAVLLVIRNPRRRNPR